MPSFQEFQVQAIEKIKERLKPGWQSPDPKHELPFHLASADFAWLQRNVSLQAPSLVTLSKEQLHELFPRPKSLTRIVRTFIWQCWLRIQMGEISPIRGNIRSFWYKYLEGFARKYGLLDETTRRRGSGKADRIIEMMGAEMANFVEHRIFRYTGDFQFRSPLGALWKVGRKRRGWFFFTEKEGLWEQLCQGLWNDEKRSVTVMASNGEPSGLVLEKLAIELWKMGVRRLDIFTFCDLDPWGWCIDASIDAMMRRLGFEVHTWRLATQDLFTDEDAEGGRDYASIIAKFTDPTYKPTSMERLIYNWFELSKGYHGKPIALHSDKVGEEVRDQRVQAFLKALETGKERPGMEVDPKKSLRLMATTSLQRMFR
jgi:hypothetical protein